ncbi:MAG: hypothetical protein H0W34_10350 [Pyrinomonadaceae bacterium]|nr:hypothetical protein [Pyrinomonadaceae bacterium]
MQADFLADEIIKIADDGLRDYDTDAQGARRVSGFTAASIFLLLRSRGRE